MLSVVFYFYRSEDYLYTEQQFIDVLVVNEMRVVRSHGGKYRLDMKKEITSSHIKKIKIRRKSNPFKLAKVLNEIRDFSV